MTNTVAKFVEVKSGQDNDAKNNWFEHCKSAETPYIIITKRTTFADVLWDHVSYSEKQGMAFREGEATIQREANLICRNHEINISKCHANSAQISIAGISIEDARKCASDIFDLISRLTRN